MIRRIKASIIFSILFVFLAASFLSAQDGELNAQEVTTYFRSARKVISDNQKIINDQSIGDKGLTGDFVTRRAKLIYSKATGLMLSENDATVAMSKAIKEVVDRAQPLINSTEKAFKGFIPAIFARQVAEEFSNNMKGKMFIKVTAPKRLLRNSSNVPDDWENSVIEEKFKSSQWTKGQAFSEKALHDGKYAYRYLMPEYYGASCLNCHGQPRGARDITGGKKEGGRLGQLGAAISFVQYY